MKRKAAALALTVAMTMAVSGSVYAEPKSTEVEPGITGNPEESEARSSVADGCETGKHSWTEWTVTIPADCVTEGQQTRSCEECGISETASIPKTKEHDLKEISRQEATDNKDGFILYACKRTKNDGIGGSDTKELPDEDIDEEYASFAYATSSEVVAEYDPETAVSTRKITNPTDPSDTEEVEGRAVSEGIVDVKKDSDGNITDLAISTSVEEIKHGFSFSSESKTPHSIAIINSKVPGVNWITLTAKEPASELGIRLKQTDDGMIMTLTENQKLVNIIRITEAKKKITMTTSTGGSCEISQEIQKFTVRDKNKNFTDIDMNEVVFHRIDGKNPYIELAALKELKKEKTSQDTAKKDEKYYWIQQYDDESQTPVVITVYEK